MFQDQVQSLPRSAARAYGAVIRNTESPRAFEHRVFTQITAALAAADSPQAHFTARIAAAHNNRELWQTLACNLADDSNALPPDLRARLISLSIWVTRETARVLQERASFADLIAINRHIMLGLQPRSQGAP
jgi:flagellar protein FlaF